MRNTEWNLSEVTEREKSNIPATLDLTCTRTNKQSLLVPSSRGRAGHGGLGRSGAGHDTARQGQQLRQVQPGYLAAPHNNNNTLNWPEGVSVHSAFILAVVVMVVSVVLWSLLQR